MNIKYLAITLIVLGLITYLIAATTLIHKELRSLELKRYIVVGPSSRNHIELLFMPKDNVTISVKCNGSIDLILLNRTNFEYLTLGLSYRALRIVRNVTSIQMSLTIPTGGKYYMVLNNSLSHSYVQAYIYVKILRYVLVEIGGSVVSVSATLVLIAGFSLLLYHLIRSIGKEVMYEVKINGIYCKSISLSKHRCVTTVPYSYEAVLPRIIQVYEALGYKLHRKLASNLIVLKRKRRRLIPKSFDDKSRYVIISARNIINGSTLTFDYEVSSWSASGSLDLKEISREVLDVISHVLS